MDFSIPILAERVPNHGYHYYGNTSRVNSDLKKLDDAGLKYCVEGERHMSIGQGPWFYYTIVHIKNGTSSQVEKAIGVKVQPYYGEPRMGVASC